LVDDDASSAVLSFFAANLAVFLFLEVLQALDFHHEVELLLFSDPFFLEFLTFDELLVTDGDNFGVEDHLVHLLNIVLLFVHESLGLGEKGLNTFHVFGLLLSRGESRSTGSVVNLHVGFTSVGASTRLFQLRLSKSGILLLLFSRDDLAGVSDSVELSLSDDGAVSLLTESSLASDRSDFFHVDHGLIVLFILSTCEERLVDRRLLEIALRSTRAECTAGRGSGSVLTS